MIEIFETWFNQFTRVEQEKLLKHIRKNHFDLIAEHISRPSNRAEKRLHSGSMGTSRQNTCSTSKRTEK